MVKTLISENPLIHVSIPREVPAEMVIWELNQVNSYIAQARKNKYSIPIGMWKGGIPGLSWKDIELEKLSEKFMEYSKRN